LDVLVKLGQISWWLPQPKFRLGCPENSYRADFLVVGRDRVWAEDVKGHITPKFARDKKLWKRYGPCALCIIRSNGLVEWVEPTACLWGTER
jgi:hypothetical protein